MDTSALITGLEARGFTREPRSRHQDAIAPNLIFASGLDGTMLVGVGAEASPALKLSAPIDAVHACDGRAPIRVVYGALDTETAIAVTRIVSMYGGDAPLSVEKGFEPLVDLGPSPATEIKGMTDHPPPPLSGLAADLDLEWLRDADLLWAYADGLPVASYDGEVLRVGCPDWAPSSCRRIVAQRAELGDDPVLLLKALVEDRKTGRLSTEAVRLRLVSRLARHRFKTKGIDLSQGRGRVQVGDRIVDYLSDDADPRVVRCHASNGTVDASFRSALAELLLDVDAVRRSGDVRSGAVGSLAFFRLTSARGRARLPHLEETVAAFGCNTVSGR